MTLFPSSSPRIAVIGAGITGITTAYKLNRRGFDVTVFDRRPLAAMETSFANGGQLSASNAEVWNSWATILKGIKWMLRKDAPLLVNPRPSWHKLSWFAEFVAACRHHEANSIETARLAIAARRHLIDMADAEGVDFNRVDRGILHFYATKADWEAGKATTDLLAKGGLERKPVTAEEIRAIEPALQGHIYGGFYTPTDFTGDIHKYTVGLAAACRRHGVAFRFDTGIERLAHVAEGVRIDWQGPEKVNVSERFDAVVIAAGCGSRALAAMLGERVNVYPVKGYSITVNLGDAASREGAPWVSLLDEQAKIVTSRLGEDRFRIAGTAEFCGENRDIREERITPLIAWCRRHFPDVSVEHVVPWAGLRPMMPDMMPRAGGTRHDRVFLNTGHGHLGWTLSAITAELTADAIEARFQGRVIQPAAAPRAAA